jgi:signal transduction histidine kinase
MQANPSAATSGLDRPPDDQMRAQERQLMWVRLAVVALGIGFLIGFGEPITGRFEVMALLGGVALYGLAIAWAAKRVPIVPLAVLGVALDVAAVTGVVWLASNVPDSYLFYALVILGAAIRFGLVAAVACSIACAALYVGVVLAAVPPGSELRELLPVRVLYLVIVGVVAGLFSRIILDRAAENARLQRRLEEEALARERAREREVLARTGREFGASLEMGPTLRGIVSGSAALVGDAVALLSVDAADGSLTHAASHGSDRELAARLRAALSAAPPRADVGAVAAAVQSGRTEVREVGAPDADPFAAQLGLGWVLAAPITAGSRTLAVLVVVGRDGSDCDERVRRTAETLADRAGPALQNALLWADLQERVVREQEAQRTKDDFLSVVSHELRTPLTSIQGYSQLLEARLRDRPNSKEMSHIQVVLSQVTRMRRLVDDLLDVNRMDRRGEVTVVPSDFDFAELVHDAVTRLVRTHIEREVELTSPQRLDVHLDRERMDQVVTNLLENAVKYSPDGGPISVTLSAGEDRLELRVADSGIGVPEADRERVFERFYQADDQDGRRRFGGLGLGLAISRGIIQAHGGEIWVVPNAEAGRGSVFGFNVPRRAEAAGGDDEDVPRFAAGPSGR